MKMTERFRIWITLASVFNSPIRFYNSKRNVKIIGYCEVWTLERCLYGSSENLLTQTALS